MTIRTLDERSRTEVSTVDLWKDARRSEKCLEYSSIDDAKSSFSKPV